MMGKICSKCKEFKTFDLFSKDKNRKNGVGSRCKDCDKLKMRKLRSAKPKIEKLCKNCAAPITNKRIYCTDCSKKIEIEKKKISNKEYYAKNVELVKTRAKNFKKSNPDKIKIYRRIESKRKRNNIAYKLHQNVSRAVRYHISRAGYAKNASIIKFLPYNMQELKDHLERLFEPWMRWDNWGKYDPKIWDDKDQSTWTWQIDHIIPQSELRFDSMNHSNFQKCWALENLRPYSAKQNVIDGIYRIRHNGIDNRAM